MSRSSLHGWLFGLAVLAASGCTDKSTETGSAGQDTTGGGNGESSTSGGGGTTTTGTPGTGASTSGGGMSGSSSGSASDPTTGCGFICPTDGGVSGECDPRVQDCPDGQKCTAVSPAPGEPWGVNKCIEIKGSSGVGDPCDIEGGKYTGVDNCGEGLICLLSDDNGMGGVCVEFCDVSDNCPNTMNAKCVVYNDGSLPICLASCDPLVQDCPEGQGCYNSAGDTFVCFKESAMPGEGMPGSECMYINQCQKGSFCAAVDAVANCPMGASGCCTPYCPVSGGDVPCQMGEMCVAFFEMGMAPPGYEDVGVCVIPA